MANLSATFGGDLMVVRSEETLNLSKHGLSTQRLVRRNWSTEALYEEAISKGAKLAQGGALTVVTGKHTGRAAKDKKIVRDATTEESIDWGDVNVPMEPKYYDALNAHILNHLEDKTLYVMDVYAGSDERYRLPVRVITESAHHAHFVRTMFIDSTPEQREGFEPEFTVLHAPSCLADPQKHGTRSETFIAVNFAAKHVLIGGTVYAGEIKKSVFGAMNYYLPPQGVLSMHASANVGITGQSAGKSAIFFGLSGTGKTTLSADASRQLIGDDEHAWTNDGVFNIEGGCYAKVIRLDPEAEPEIYATTSRYGTLLENVVMHEDRSLDLDDNKYTENTRAAYPIEFIPNHKEDGMGPQPSDIIMLTADAFGVLPPIARLSTEQAMYWFMLGYTAKVAGTEMGVTEPQATFSACFGAPFMPRHPSAYAKLLGEKIEKHGVRVWLLNTGWTGGPYGQGERMKIKYTRAMLNAALDGKLDSVTMTKDPIFGLEVPSVCPGVPDNVLNPKTTWSDGAAYDAKAKELAGAFVENFKVYASHVTPEVLAVNPNA